MKDYFLREYGSWSVLIISYAIGLGSAGGFTWLAAPVFLALALLVNSKQAFMKWSRGSAKRKSLSIFICQAAVAAAILFSVFSARIIDILPFLVVPAAYLLVNIYLGEHTALTELLGFAVLALASVTARYLVDGVLDIRLFIAVALYFGAGVFKVKALLLKGWRHRLMAVFYVVFTAVVYGVLGISLAIITPLLENIISASGLYGVRLRTTGWIEVVKGILFSILAVSYL